MATGILAMLARPKGKGGSKSESPDPMGESSSSGGDEVASSLREMFDLLKSGDDEGAALAFRRAYEECAGGHEEPDADEMGGPSDEDEDNLDL